MRQKAPSYPQPLKVHDFQISPLRCMKVTSRQSVENRPTMSYVHQQKVKQLKTKQHGQVAGDPGSDLFISQRNNIKVRKPQLTTIIVGWYPSQISFPTGGLPGGHRTSHRNLSYSTNTNSLRSPMPVSPTPALNHSSPLSRPQTSAFLLSWDGNHVFFHWVSPG